MLTELPTFLTDALGYRIAQVFIAAEPINLHDVYLRV